MDWTLTVLLSSVLCLCTHAVRLTPFNGFSDIQYEPVADYSIHQGVYLPNMPSASIYPLFGEDQKHSMVGIPTLKPPFVNPLLSQMNLFKNKLNNLQNVPKVPKAPPLRHSNGGRPAQSVNRPHRTRGVTLDVRGGGYKMESPHNPRPYNAPPGSQASIRKPQRPIGERPSRPNGIRKPNQSHRGPTMKNPHYNMKFETSLASIPPNVEFVNPENVLPLHPNIYKQFLKQNPQMRTFLRNQHSFQSHGTSPPRSKNFREPPQSQAHNFQKPAPPKNTRNRGQLPSSLAQFSSIPSGFQIPPAQLSGPQLAAHGQFPQLSPDQSSHPLLGQDIFSADPQFYAALSQTNEGRAILEQMYQQYGAPSNKPIPSSQNIANGVPQTVATKIPSSQFATSSTGFSTAPAVHGGNSFAALQGANQFASPMISSDQTDAHFNRQPASDYSSMQFYAQEQQQHVAPKQPASPQQTAALGQPSIPQQEQIMQLQYSTGQHYPEYTTLPSFGETNPPSSLGQDSFKPYVDSQNTKNLYSPYIQNQGAYMQSSPELSNPSYSAGVNAYEQSSSYPVSYQNPKKVAQSPPSGHQDRYTSSFSPMDPLPAMDSDHHGHNPAQDYYSYHNSNPSSYHSSGSRGQATALHEISPSSNPAPSRPEAPKTASSPGYWTPEQLFAPQSTGLQSEPQFGYSPSTSTSLSMESPHDGRNDDKGAERAALHLPQEASPWVTARPDHYSGSEGDASDSADDEISKNPSAVRPIKTSYYEEELHEQYQSTIRDLQKLRTQNPYEPFTESYQATTVTTEAPTTPESRRPVYRDDLKNHRTTASYTYQYSPADKTSPKSSSAWWSRKPDGVRYKIPAPPTEVPTTSPTTTTITTTTMRSTFTTPPPPTIATETTTTESPSTTTTATAKESHYHDTETPICARHNNLTYCLQDPEYPKETIRRAIERNRHPLDHFLVDISAASNVVDDALNGVLENSAPLQSTSISYSFEGNVIAPSPGEALNSTGCNSNIYYGKPLRALNTAGLWKIIVNVEFEDTGANYTQTVRIEECIHPPGFVATCGTHAISACLQQYKLYRLLAWEPHRGFYIDAFLLPVACFCGSQQSDSK